MVFSLEVGGRAATQVVGSGGNLASHRPTVASERGAPIRDGTVGGLADLVMIRDALAPGKRGA